MRPQALLLLSAMALACRSEKVDSDGLSSELPDTPEDADGDGFIGDEDCSDDDASVHPDAPELCDGIDNNCDGVVDDDAIDTTAWFADTDGDGHGDPTTSVQACEAPLDHVSSADDCDDSRADVHPDAVEVCNEVDDDCDGDVDEELESEWFSDADDDGFGDAGTGTWACEAEPGQVADSTDCDDADPAVFPGAEEVCNEVDDNCDGLVDEGVTTTFYVDLDGDDFGGFGGTTEACAEPEGYASVPGDCDDADVLVHPDAIEVCDLIDNDCDGDTDESDAADAATWYADLDGDGYGDLGSPTLACSQPSDHVVDTSDCDDTDGTVNPSTTELCDSVDNDCDGTIDEDDASDALTWYSDSDGDGYGDAASSTLACDAPSGHVSDDADCDDGDGAVNPAATELCDSVDNDCDGTIDESDAADADTWYADSDADGYGDATSTTLSCDEPTGYVDDDTDCDDASADVNPGADEICSGIDEDCDGVTDDLGPTELFAGSLTAGESKTFQYSPVTTGGGYLYANWTRDVRADSFEVAIGSTPGDDDIETWTDVGAVSSTTLTGLTLDGAWDGAEYYLSIRPTNGTTACATSATASMVQVAEAAVWTGDVADLRTPDALGGYTADWPETGVDAVYGEHWFEEVDLGSSTTVYVQGWGAEDAVSAGISATDLAVTDPLDGWVAFYANDITIEGALTATGRGYGGGGGGGAGVRGGYQGDGGSLGLGGDGGPASTSYAGAGGGGSPGGAGGVGATTGGAGNMYGGGGGSTGCSGSHGRAGGDGSVGTVGGTGGTASSGSPGTAGVGEFSVGGGRGVSGCDNWSGGGGGAYGAGGGGGSQWAGSTSEASGGGAGGAGGSGGGRTVNGATAAGPYGGAGGTNSGVSTGSAGTDGGYLAGASNGDASTDRSWALGSGGGGGSGGYQETGGGGGGAGGGAILLYAVDTLTLESTAYLLANGAGGGGGARDNGGNSTSAVGGVGAGGTLILEAQELEINVAAPYISAVGGDGATSNGGTIKLFYDSLSGTTPGSGAAGRVYDAGAGSWVAP